MGGVRGDLEKLVDRAKYERAAVHLQVFSMTEDVGDRRDLATTVAPAQMSDRASMTTGKGAYSSQRRFYASCFSPTRVSVRFSCARDHASC